MERVADTDSLTLSKYIQSCQNNVSSDAGRQHAVNAVLEERWLKNNIVTRKRGTEFRLKASYFLKIPIVEKWSARPSLFLRGSGESLKCPGPEGVEQGRFLWAGEFEAALTENSHHLVEIPSSLGVTQNLRHQHCLRQRCNAKDHQLFQ